jgi:hypothetical protein
MAAKELTAKNKTIGKWFGGTDFTPPATWYVALLDASDTELSGNGYARVAVTNNTTNFPTPTTGQNSISIEVTFPVATGDWTEAVKVGLYTASSGGTREFKTLLEEPATVLDGVEFFIPAGSLVFIES